MKVIQLLPELNEGGVERLTVDLSRELVKRGIESVVISAGGKLAERIEKEGGRHIRLDVAGKNPMSMPWRVAALRRIIEREKPDILHAQSRVPAWLAWFASKPFNIPFITTVHGFHSVNPYSQVMTYGNQVICVSNAIRDYVVENYNTSIDKLRVIPCGIDMNTFNPKYVNKHYLENFKVKYRLSKKFVVTVVGRITQLKDLETFIQGIALMKKEIPNVCGLIVGGVHNNKKEYFLTLQQLVDRLSLNENIIFTGSQDKMAEIYALSNVVVSSSKKPESFGLSVAEAIAMNTPVVATRHGGVMDIILEGKNGYFYSAGDAEALKQAVINARDLQFDGFDYIKKEFSLDRMVEQIMEVYNAFK